MDVERLLREADFSRNSEHKAALWRMLSQKRLQMERSKRLADTEEGVLTETELEAIAAGTGNIAFPSPEQKNRKNIGVSQEVGR